MPALQRIVRVSLPRFAFGNGRLGWAAALLLAVLLGTAAAAPARGQIANLDDVVQFTQRAPAVSDARSLGMAGTGRAGLAGGTALYYNPAGLGWMEASMASGALAVIGAEEEARFSAGFPSTTEDVTDYGGHFALAYKFPTEQGSLVFAGAYNQVNTFARQFAFQGNEESQLSITRQIFLPFEDEYSIGEDEIGEFIDWSGSIYPEIAFEGGAIEYFPFEYEQGNYPFEPAVLSGTTVEQIGTVGSEGRLNEVSLGAGVEVARGVMLGLSANVAFGRYGFSNAYSELDNGGNDDYEVIRDGATYRGLDEVRLEEHFTSNLSGGNLRGGLSVQAAPGVRLGLTVETPTLYRVDETFTEAEITTFFDDGGSLSYGGQPGDVGTVENEYEVHTPWRLGAGAQVGLLQLTDGVADLTLAGDVEFVDWSQLERSSEVIALDPEQQSNENYDAVFNTSLGAEYRTGGAAFRAGFAYRPDPHNAGPDARTEPLEGQMDSDRIFYSLGAGYRFAENLRVDVGWMQERFDDEFAGFAVPPGGDNWVPSAEEEVSRSRFLVGVRYFF